MDTKTISFTTHPTEKSLFFFMAAVSSIFYGVLIMLGFWKPELFGTLMFYVGLLAGIRAIVSLFLIGHIKGNAIKLSPSQFPEAYNILQQYGQKLGFSKTPETYVLQGGGMLNAFATRFSRRNFVVLYSDVLEMAYQEGLDAVSFIIGHELGHIKRHHVSFWKNIVLMPASVIPFVHNAYSRACEYTCDRIGYALCPAGALKGLLILAAGKRLYTKVNAVEMVSHLPYENGFALSIAEIFSTHPALIKRIAVIVKLDKHNLRVDTPAMVSPSITVENQVQV